MNGHTMSESDWFDLKAAPSGSGCLNCSAEDPPGWWFHLRRCTYCGHVGCCDSSPQQHASEHYRQTGHPILQSFEPGEEWFYDHRTNVFVTGPALAPPRAHPLDQPVPGPRGRVPVDWSERLH
jgi:hypothetical protein